MDTHDEDFPDVPEHRDSGRGDDRGDRDDHRGRDDGRDDADDGWGDVRGTLTAVDGSAPTVATSPGDSTPALDATTDVVRDHEHVDLDALATGQDVVVVQGRGSTASRVVVPG